ncbi:MAG: translation initiation factor IF-2, partial [Lachnospiraceae bacterium]|nr:translation initiation factor IF-2 [Lachnospiraceae bacterium]
RNNKAGRFIKPEKKKEEVVEDIKTIVIPDEITIKDLADKMKIQPSAIVKKLFLQGEMVTVNQEISFERAEEIALDYEIMCEREEKVDVIAELLKEEEEDTEDLIPRPPVICVMGHVDHGKTSLLDAIRKTNVTDREAGGITQHIGAYTVMIDGRQITFLDTPGHEAFTSMRMRGANSTDIAILVVAADDGVMPQTVEAINHAKAAGIEIVVAVNKIDKPGANIDRVKQELSEYELIPEDWGGTTIFANVSAKTGEGIEELLEMILLSADVLELKANPNRRARGLVIEAELDKGRGPVATVLVQKGTLHVGDFISAGASHGKVRAMVDDKGRRVKEALPSTPVEILGLNDVPNAGEIFICHSNDKEAKTYAETFIAQNKVKLLEDTKAKMSLDDLFSKIKEGNLKELNLIIKADVQGSVEAVKQSLLKLSNEEVVVKAIHGGVGAINESDVILASASNAIIIGFNVRPDAMAKQTAEREGVDLRLYRVIYQAIEDIEAAMKGMLDPIFEEKIIGHAEVRQIFKASQIGNIAGAFVLDGEFQRNCKIRITREGEQIYEGALASLKRFKDDVKEVKAGYECGLVFEDFDQMQELDIVEAYIMVEVPRT